MTFRVTLKVKNPFASCASGPFSSIPAAAHFFGLKTVYTPMRDDYRADPAAFEAHINRNTALIVVSATQYPHGVVDPVHEIAAIGQKRGIPVAVDACIGGFMLPFVEKLGHKVPEWDFR